MKRYCRIRGIKHSFDSLSTSTSSNQNSPIKYYCMSCGKEHKEIECPNCGSKMNQQVKSLNEKKVKSFIRTGSTLKRWEIYG
jgi:DNA-directed RNA polymerase subunit RPC12/RpoP